MREKGKKVVALAAVCILVVCAAYVYRPRPLGRRIDKGVQLYISATELGVKDGQSVTHTSEYTILPGDVAYGAVYAVLESYSFHATVTALPGQNAVEGISCAIVLSAGGQDVLTVTDRGILFNGQLYRVGFWGYGREETLAQQLLLALSG